MDRFEYYKYINAMDIPSEDLKTLGINGWELVNFSYTSGMHGTKWVYVFKRVLTIEDNDIV